MGLFRKSKPTASSPQISQLGSPVLRQIAQPVVDVKDPSIQTLIDEMLQKMKASNGVGIAAPQLGRSLRLLIVASHPNARYPNAPKMEPTAMINPTIVSECDTMVKDWEGCLSVPGIRGLVPRSTTVEVTYTDRNGNIKKSTLTDFVARIFLHEYDHLEGKVFLDRVESSLELITDSEYVKLIEKANASQNR
jgi:peptide deformylase